ncbi:thioredoxin domain-containing protein [Clostridium polyendosporum]|uniref:Thioredoxin domain-containing protein n=1 Tax=Clostridium polyendosporum TaxID=69208 RepID=A0A919VF07_9CLOT|nr:thioredoxin domain-containing protein [Clostridium polyendosporum]GIM27647.1 thioredoxin domain-containing protein [Clostridium polyendosporum]
MENVKDKKSNKLINQKSPYLLQHAYNPVDWYPWGEEAFEKAEKEDKPIFLSIGYSTCHWCHVMERESFEDDEVADVLNKYFVSIKVDREERPDVDHIYMTVCQTLTGHGGWPLTIFLTPDKKPFFAATYIPKHDRMGMQGLISILQRAKDAWKNNRSDILESSNHIMGFIDQSNDIMRGDFDEGVAEEAFFQFTGDFDSVYGGFGGAPKFPTPHNLSFLLRYWYKTKDNSALKMVEKTLESMYKGGIYDHIGYGFSRYSTDNKWLVPHFEKMLYDNALLAIAYLETYQATKNKKYSDIAQEIFTYVLRDMTSPEGGFYSAEDADSEGEEGKFYVWSVHEIKSILGEEEGEKFCRIFDITPNGNFEGKNIPNLIRFSIPENELQFVKRCRERLFSYREKRVHPYKDDKILTSWNGLMIAAMAIGGRVLNNKEYSLAAERAVEFIYKNLVREDGRLLARYRDGEAAFPAYADDYAFLAWGLIELYETTYNPDYLKKAVDLNNDLLRYFWDVEKGGLFVYGSDSEQLITRPKEIYDGATPSGNAVSALNLLRLARLTGDYELEDKAHRILKAFGNQIVSYPKGHAFSLMALLFIQSPTKEVVVVADSNNNDAQNMINIINSEFRPFTVSVFFSSENSDLKSVAPFITDYKSVDGKATAYVCENFACQAPVTSSDQLEEMLTDAVLV